MEVYKKSGSKLDKIATKLEDITAITRSNIQPLLNFFEIEFFIVAPPLFPLETSVSFTNSTSSNPQGRKIEKFCRLSVTILLYN